MVDLSSSFVEGCSSHQPSEQQATDSAMITVPRLSDDAEVDRLRKELEAAQYKIARMDLELSQTRIAEHTLHQAIGSSTGSDIQIDNLDGHYSSGWISQRRSVSPQPSTQSGSCQAINPLQAGDGLQTDYHNVDQMPNTLHPASQSRNGWSTDRATWHRPEPLHEISSAQVPLSRRPGGIGHEPGEDGSKHGRIGYAGMMDPTLRRHAPQASQARPGPRMNEIEWSPYPASSSSTPAFSPPMTPMPFASHGYSHGSVPYQPRPLGAPLSPTALEFSAAAMSLQGSYPGSSIWTGSLTTESAPSAGSFMSHAEPMNYRRLLDKNMSCNWKYIVDKIVCSNDQQASIFLQQKLKVATPEQKFELIEAIIAQAYPLMINRFGNFLVQRCFEHGTPEQVIAIANAIRGNTLNLSMDAFGCHVVQKAFDAVPEEYKAIMVHELLRRIPETVIHRYACHVWQKLFELRWSDSPPQIMKYVNEALRGMWHEVALGETGSLVVQNIFENCLEEDKRPCVNEVLASIDIVSHGQFGNWCIQHICEHGAPADKSRAIEHVLRFATEYSTDQFASKVVEKCLKVGSPGFLSRYLDRVCEGRTDRPRMPLIDIAGDQYGNYLVQHILVNADPQNRDLVAQHVRKHMVSLRGSKFGSRVAMLCSNPALSTRPGPPTSMPMGGRYFQGSNNVNGNIAPRSSLPGPYR